MRDERARGGGSGLGAMLLGATAFLLWLVIAPPSVAREHGLQESEDLASRVEAAPNGSVRFSYAVRDGVCGDGHRISIGFDNDGPDEDWYCHPGPSWVEIEKVGARVLELDWWVGRTRSSQQAPRTDLGEVGPAEAAEYLMSLTRRVDGELADEAIGAASVAADVEIWPELLELAQDERLDTDTREAAIFWLAELAGERATEDLERLVQSDDELEVKEAALFGLSRLPDGAGVDAMIKVARENDDPELVQASMFWLGQTGDPRAISLFKEILVRD